MSPFEPAPSLQVGRTVLGASTLATGRQPIIRLAEVPELLRRIAALEQRVAVLQLVVDRLERPWSERAWDWLRGHW